MPASLLTSTWSFTHTHTNVLSTKQHPYLFNLVLRNCFSEALKYLVHALPSIPELRLKSCFSEFEKLISQRPRNDLTDQGLPRSRKQPALNYHFLRAGQSFSPRIWLITFSETLPLRCSRSTCRLCLCLCVWCGAWHCQFVSSLVCRVCNAGNAG